MNPLQKTIHLATTDAQFRLALQTEGAAAPSTSLRTSLSQQGLALSPEEMEVLYNLRDCLVLPAASLAERFRNAFFDITDIWG